MSDGEQNSPDHGHVPLNLAFAEVLYEDWQRDPLSVPEDWREYFGGLPAMGEPARPGPSFRPPSLFHPTKDACETCAVIRQEADVAARQDRVDQIVRAYRVRGHLIAHLDPLGLPRPPHPELDPSYYGFTEADMDKVVSSRTIAGSPGALSFREVLERLRNTYCRTIGAQYMHIDDIRPKMWLQERMEASQNRIHLTREEQLRLLTKLTDAVVFEEFIHRKYIGAKRFSLEGAESLIPLLDIAVETAAEHGIDEIVFGMAHRGRINVLANIVDKSPAQIFREFDDNDPENFFGRGDVKYHMGHSTDATCSNGRKIHLTLCFNPSHLEFVNPVAVGRTRAKEERRGDAQRTRGLTVLIHGDAAFAGQGIVQETLNMSELPGYATGGTLHVIVNNQIGFTTDPAESRSTTYATDVAKMLQVPIFHVNGEDPEAVAQVIHLAMDYRREFHRDVVIDMYAYRRYGHNEGDEPEFTQPLMYAAIKRRKSVREGYLDRLLALGGVTQAEADQIARARRENLERELSVARSPEYQLKGNELRGTWAGYLGGDDAAVPEPDTGVPEATLARLLDALTHVPDGFTPHPKIARWLGQRREMAEGKRPLDWSAAEALALATLAVEGHPVRVSGQDSQRGTFSHRHAALTDLQTGARWLPLQHLAPDQAPVTIVNSPLSEAGVLGFEYGYSLEMPEALVIWEAQFGDFVNGAQVIVDQFLVSAEDKWERLSGLALLLPHGFEGQGPEHSSARLERFMALAADDNIQLIQPTTPAQYYHALRRQVVRPLRKPLVVMTPKSLLRHPQVVSSLDELAAGRFRRILPDAAGLAPDGVTRVLLATGKVYYDLAKAREESGRRDVAILRLEQLYPLADSELAAALEPYRPGTPLVWVQEEPENMGAWRTLRVRFGETLLGRWPFSGVTRESSASPATGSAKSHALEQQQLVERAFAVEVRM
jgi:2-oxoglutarate dehydrogenase E1 component